MTGDNLPPITIKLQVPGCRTFDFILITPTVVRWCILLLLLGWSPWTAVSQPWRYGCDWVSNSWLWRAVLCIRQC